MDTKLPRTKLSVYLYIPNIIGYIRILMNCLAFAVCFSNKKLFSILYLISFVCDALDGYFARKLNQVSTFGAVLDMVTDRISTACLLVILSQVYRPGLIFLSLLALDIASHWLQMYSTFLFGRASHKDVKDSTNWLFKAYYGNRIFMAYCCVFSLFHTQNCCFGLREACEAALKEKHFLDDSQTEGFVDEFATSHLEQLEVLRRVFREAAEADTPAEVPDYLCCKITLDILRDPVITPSGVTYEKAVILEHLQKVGKFDPITREPLNQSQLIPNLAIKEAVQAFLDKHGWAYKMD